MSIYFYLLLSEENKKVCKLVIYIFYIRIFTNEDVFAVTKKWPWVTAAQIKNHKTILHFITLQQLQIDFLISTPS